MWAPSGLFLFIAFIMLPGCYLVAFVAGAMGLTFSITRPPSRRVLLRAIVAIVCGSVPMLALFFGTSPVQMFREYPRWSVLLSLPFILGVLTMLIYIVRCVVRKPGTDSN
jgi:hypothetical protein